MVIKSILVVLYNLKIKHNTWLIPSGEEKTLLVLCCRLLKYVNILMLTIETNAGNPYLGPHQLFEYLGATGWLNMLDYTVYQDRPKESMERVLIRVFLPAAKNPR